MTTDTGQVPSETTEVLTATIANGQTVSDALDIGQFRLMAFQFASMTGTAMTFQGSDTLGGTYVAIDNSDGNAVSITIASDKCVSLVGDAAAAMAPWRFIKLVSGSAEGAERTVKVILRS